MYRRDRAVPRCGRVQTFTRQREDTIQVATFRCSRNVLGYSRHYRTSEGTTGATYTVRRLLRCLQLLHCGGPAGPPRMPVLSCCCCCCSEHSHKPNERHDAPSSSSSHTMHVSVATHLLRPFNRHRVAQGLDSIISHHLPSSPIISHGFNHLPSSGRAVPPAPRKSAMKSPSDSPRELAFKACTHPAPHPSPTPPPSCSPFHQPPPSTPTVGGRVLMLGA